MNLRTQQDALLYDDMETRMSSHNKIIRKKICILVQIQKIAI